MVGVQMFDIKGIDVMDISGSEAVENAVSQVSSPMKAIRETAR
jgi:hypothetical protein